MADLLALAGRQDRARKALQEVDDPNEMELGYLFEAALELGEYALALEYLEASIPTFDPLRRLIHCDGRTAGLAGDPRFGEVLDAIGVPEFRSAR